MTDFSLALTTALKPTKKFTVDGDEFEMLGIDHLSPDDEADTVALFARLQILQGDLEVQANVTKGATIAKAMKATRETILTKLTTMPRPVASKLPLSQQVLLLEALEAEVSVEDSGVEPDPEAEVAALVAEEAVAEG
jgi:hypothetical protein